MSPNSLLTLPKRIAFLDLETTSLDPLTGKVIEIGIIKVEHNQVTQFFQTLVKPNVPIPPETYSITGISPKELSQAPSFKEVLPTVINLISDTHIAAHNASFDYPFLSQELSIHGITLTRPCFCTVKLFKHLVPGKKHYNLDELLNFFHLSCPNRHRALDDARVISDFYQKALSIWPENRLLQAINFATETFPLPKPIKTLQPTPLF